jgi:hypothetical protein
MNIFSLVSSLNTCINPTLKKLWSASKIMKVADWQPNRRVTLEHGMIMLSSRRDKNNGVTTDTPPTRELVSKIEVRLDSGELVTIAANRVQYVTDYV